MKRLYEADAYGPEPIDNCFWNRSILLPPLPSLTGSLTLDMAFNGAGFTGLSTALLLAHNRIELAIVNAETPFWGPQDAMVAFADMERFSL